MGIINNTIHMRSFIACALFGALVASATLPNCDEQCKDTCCRNGGGDACVRACGCNEACRTLGAADDNCKADIAKAGADLTKAATDVIDAVKACAGSDKAACSAAVTTIISELGVATTDISGAVKDCSGSGSECATDIGNTVTALGNAATSIA